MSSQGKLGPRSKSNPYDNSKESIGASWALKCITDTRFNFMYPEYDPKKLGLYSGKILISGSNKEELSVPYMG